jgi:Paraquat-inducible protein A
VPVLVRSLMPPRALGFTNFHMNDGSQRQVSKTGHFVLLCLLIVVALLLCVGVTEKCFVFEIGGLAGMALGDGNRSAYSVLSFGEAIPSSTEHPTWISIRLLQFIFYFYTIAMPFMALTLLSTLWVVPLQRSFQFPLMTLAEVSNAWSAIEVFCLSIIAALLEIETFTNFIIGHRCDWINRLLVQYHETVGVDKCYSVAASVSWNGMFLVMGAILNSFLVSFVLRVLHASMLERSLDTLSQDSLADASPSFVQKLAASRWSAWFFCELEDDELNNFVPISESNINATFLEDDVSDLLQYGEASTDEWNETTDQDLPTKEWKKETNVT